MSDEDDKPAERGSGAISGPSPISSAALAPGLHLVATPIGTARDITLRALDTLRAADVIAAEDTRTARRLLELHGIALAGRPLLPYHDHNGPMMRPKLLKHLEDGARVAFVSDAGTPLVADPGYQLVRAVVEAGLPVTAAPGPSAALVALSLSGLPSDRFLFAGFPPSQTAARRAWMANLDAAQATVIVFESPKRIHRILGEFCEALGAERKAALCRELTKKFEDVTRGTLGALRDHCADRPPKGECVLVIDRADAMRASPESVRNALREEMKDQSLKAAVATVTEGTGLSRRDVYQIALQIKQEQDDDG